METYNIHSGIRWNISEAAKDQGHTDLANPGHSRKDASKAVDYKGSSEASQPEILQTLVDGARGEQMFGTDGAPDDTGIVERLDVGTSKVSCGF